MISKPAGNLFSGIAITMLLTMGFATTGCGNKGGPSVASDSKAFEVASPEIKTDWEKARSAAASHDYATAILTCRRLQTQGGLTPQQLTAVTGAITAVNNQLLEAAQKGDQKAIQALEEVRNGWRHPQ